MGLKECFFFIFSHVLFETSVPAKDNSELGLRYVYISFHEHINSMFLF